MFEHASKKVNDGKKSDRGHAEARHADESFDQSANSPSSVPIIHRKASCACGGGCPDCQAKPNNLNISQPNDPAEIEADAIADKVMRKASNENFNIRRNPTSEMQAKRSSPSNESSVSGDIGARVNSSIGTGSALDRNTRGSMEFRFGTGLDHIRIHTGKESAKLNRELSAKAFTLGNDIFFGDGNYQPGTAEGQHLIAHELAHTMQGGRQIRRQWEDVFEDPGFEQPGLEQPGFEQPGFGEPGSEQPAGWWEKIFGKDKKVECAHDLGRCNITCRRYSIQSQAYDRCMKCCQTGYDICISGGAFITPEGGCARD